MKNLLVKIYTLWVIIVFSVFMIILLPFIILPILLGNGRITYAALRWWSWIFSKLTFIRYEIKNRHFVDRKQSYIYTSNHTSFLDAPGIRLAIPTQFRPLAKKELLKIPVFGLIVKTCCIIVDRSNAKSRKESIKKLTSYLKQKISILLFAEGTQNRTKEILQPFYDGAFRIAIETQTPIMPMVVINAGKLMPPSGLTIKPGKIKVVFGEAVPVEGMTLKDLPQLKEKVFNLMKDLIVANRWSK